MSQVTLTNTGSGSTTTPVSLDSLIAGEDQTNNWLGVASAANQYINFKPLTVNSTVGVDSTTFPAASGSNGMLIGTVGAVGDYLGKLIVSVKNSNNSRVALQDISAVSLTSTGAATWATGTPTAFTFLSSTASVATSNTLVGQFLVATYTVNSTSVVIARKILAATATVNTSYALTIDTPALIDGANNIVVPTAVVTTAGTHFISPLIEVLPVNMQGIQSIEFGLKSKYGGWRLFVDAGVNVIAVGKFS